MGPVLWKNQLILSSPDPTAKFVVQLSDNGPSRIEILVHSNFSSTPPEIDVQRMDVVSFTTASPET